MEFTPRDKFKTETFLVILNRLSAELTRRGECYKLLCKKFKVLESLLDKEIPTNTLPN